MKGVDALKAVLVGVLLGAILAWSYGADEATAREDHTPSWIDLTDEAYLIPELEAQGFEVSADGTVWAPKGCYVLDLEGIAEESLEGTRDALTQQGWYPDPTDGLEALYSPGCAS